MKKIALACLFAVSLVSAGIADPSEYTSGASEPETPVVNINHVENDEPLFAVSVHPVSMLILSIFDIPSIYLTIEGNLGSHLSLITRPSYVWKDFSDSNRDLDIFIFGLSEGLRYYFSEGHRGLFAAAHFNYARAGMDYEYKNHPEDNEKLRLNGFGFGAYVGHKVRSGHFTMSIDIGYSYVRYSATGKNKDDLDDVTSVGSGLDLNYTIGVAF